MDLQWSTLLIAFSTWIFVVLSLAYSAARRELNPYNSYTATSARSMAVDARYPVSHAATGLDVLLFTTGTVIRLASAPSWYFGSTTSAQR